MYQDYFREKRLTQYLELLLEDNKKQVIERKSDASFRFEDSEEIKANKSVEIPARIVGLCTSIRAKVASKGILFLLSNKAMKDKVEVFGSDLVIICSTSGHYCIPTFCIQTYRP